MNLEQWRSNGWLKSHRTDAAEWETCWPLRTGIWPTRQRGGCPAIGNSALPTTPHSNCAPCCFTMRDTCQRRHWHISGRFCPSYTRWDRIGEATQTISTLAEPSGTTSNTTTSTGLRRWKRRSFLPMPRTCGRRWLAAWRQSIQSLSDNIRGRFALGVLPL